MNYFATAVMLLLAHVTFSQSRFPDFLEGTWKMADKEHYEHWDRLNTHTLKGIAYQLKDGLVQVTEYLEITQRDQEVVYTPTVPGQNQGRGIDFTLAPHDSIYSFENAGHDFPKKIGYQKRSATELAVYISDGKQRTISYLLKKVPGELSANPNYDPQLAQKLGADDYGMKSYILVMLKTGSNKTTDKAFIGESFRGHLDNIGRLVTQGKLVVAGPLGKNENSYRGIFILNAATLEEAKALLATDPAIKENLLEAELYNWFGSAALPEYLEASDKVWKIKP